MKEDENMIEAGAKLVTEYLQSMSTGIFHHWKDVFLNQVETFT